MNRKGGNFVQNQTYLRALFNIFNVWLSITMLLVIVIACTESNKNQVCRIVESTSTSPMASATATESDDDISGIPTSIFIKNDYAYLGFDASFVILDISDPTNPQQINSISLPVTSIEIVGSYAFLTEKELHIFDISEPRELTEVHCEDNKSFEFLNAVIIDNYAFRAGGTEGLKVFDVSNPSELVEISSYAPRSWPYIRLFPRPEVVRSQPRLIVDVVVYEKYAYLAESLLGTDSLYDGQIRILDISDPAKLRILSTYEMPNNAGIQKIIVDNKRLFASTSYMDTPSSVMLDVSEPTNPIEINTPSMPNGLVAVHDNYAFFATGSSGLQVWDISDPATPIQFTWTDLHYGYVIDVVISDNYAFFATRYGGFRIVDITAPTLPVTVSVSFD